MSDHTRRGFLRNTSAVVVGSTAVFATGTATGQSDIPDVIEDDDGRGTIHVIRNTDTSEFHHPYLLFKPDPEPTTERPLFAAPGSVRDVSSQEEVLQKATDGHVLMVEWTQFNAAKFNQMPGIVPLFPTTPNDDPTFIQSLVLPSYKREKLSEAYQLDELATDGYSVESLTRIDKQFAAMITDAQRRLDSEPYPVADQIHLDGFSVTGDFTTRFAFLYPHLVRALSAGGGGFAPLPTTSMTVDGSDIELPYPLGTADYEQVTGREFDLAEWNSIAQWFYLGENDEPWKDGDTISYQHPSSRYPDRATAVFGRERVTSMFTTLQDVYTTAGANATFNLYEDTGHEVTREMLDDMIAFHSEQLGVLNVETNPSTVMVNESTDVTVTVTNTATDDVVEGATVEIVSLNESETTTANGTATLSVNATETGDLTVAVTAAGFVDASSTLTTQFASDRPADLPDGISTESFSAVDSNGDGSLSPSEIALAISQNAGEGTVNGVEVSPSEFALMISWNLNLLS